MREADPRTVAELLARVDSAWDALQATVRQLTETELTERRDTAGWAAKDHLMHVAAWEQVFLGRFQGRPPHETLGLDPSTADQDDDTVNAILFTRHRHRPLRDVLEALRTSHAATRARLAALTDGDLEGTRATLVPAATGGEADPVVPWIAGSTWEHYGEHHAWIRALAGRA